MPPARPIELVPLYVDRAHHRAGVAAVLMQRCTTKRACASTT